MDNKTSKTKEKIRFLIYFSDTIMFIRNNCCISYDSANDNAIT